MGSYNYFFAAYVIIWIVVFAYLFRISRSEKKIQRELMELTRLVSRSDKNMGAR
jgi:CcmD family protein